MFRRAPLDKSAAEDQLTYVAIVMSGKQVRRDTISMAVHPGGEFPARRLGCGLKVRFDGLQE